MESPPELISPHVRWGKFATYSEPGWGLDQWRRKRLNALKLPRLSYEIERQRREIIPAPWISYQGSFYCPCEVRVSDQDWIDHVCLIRATDWAGPWPHENDGPYLEVSQLLEIRESPSRLPPPFIYQAEGKAQPLGFNGSMIELVYRDGSSTVVGGDFCEFPPYPDDKGPADVVEVRTPARDRMPEALFPARPIWCLVS